jgi:SAM-dependent methyltransferase
MNLQFLKNSIKTLFKLHGNSFKEPDARDKYLETMELSYLYSMFNLFNRVHKLPGHIVELGVGAGRNSILFGKLLKFSSQHSNSKYFGFDTFESYTKQDLKENNGLSDTKWKDNSVNFVKKRIENHGLGKVCEFIAGDIRHTLPKFIKTSHSRHSSGTFYCRLVYVDTSAYTPSKEALKALYDLVVPGGIISIDQRRQGGEWKALIEFCEENNCKLEAGDNFNDLPAYIIKK